MEAKLWRSAGGIRGAVGRFRLPAKRPMRDAVVVGVLVALLWAPFIFGNWWMHHDSRIQSLNVRLQRLSLSQSRELYQQAVMLQRILQRLTEESEQTPILDALVQQLLDWRSFHLGSRGAFVVEGRQPRLLCQQMGPNDWDPIESALQQQWENLQRRMAERRVALRFNPEETLSGIQRNPVVTSLPFEVSGRWVMVLYGETERMLQDGGSAVGFLLDLDWYLNEFRLLEDNGSRGDIRASLYASEDRLLVGSAISAKDYPVVCQLAVPGDRWQLFLVPGKGWTNWSAGLILANTLSGLAMSVAAAFVTLLFSQARHGFESELERANQGLAEALEQRMASEEARDRAIADLAKSRQLESVGRLAGGVAHEFNNLLQVILGHTELLMKDLQSSRPVADGLQQIDRAGRRAAELTKQLLQFSRREPQEAAVVDLVSSVSDGLRLMKPALKKSIRIVWNAPDTELLVPLDGLHLDQILLNLLLNADLAMPAGGTIELRVRLAGTGEAVGDGAFCEQPSVVLTVTDEGCGMSGETLSRVFEPFYSTRGPAAGTGLGLSLVYGLMRQCGGGIHLSSAVDKGTTATLVFPSVAGGGLTLSESVNSESGGQAVH